MSQLLSGSEPSDLSDRSKLSYTFSMSDASQVGEARRFAIALSDNMAFDETRRGRVGIVINELGNNLVRYATGGELVIQRVDQNGLQGLEILSIDRGPGLTSSVVMADGFTTGTTPGTGLGSVRRQSDVFDIYSQAGKGTVILSRVFLEGVELRSARFEIGAICRPIKGETISGDDWYVEQRGDHLTAIVADGLGHGPQANKAASEAIEVFRNSQNDSLDRALQLIHGRLKSTRGAAVFLLATDQNIVHFTSAGNIRTIILKPEHSKTLISQNGTAGLQIRRTQVHTEAWNGEGFLILHSDGVTSRWDLSPYPGIWVRHPSILAALIYRDFSRGNDDATVLVIRAAGTGS